MHQNQCARELSFWAEMRAFERQSVPKPETSAQVARIGDLTTFGTAKVCTLLVNPVFGLKMVSTVPNSCENEGTGCSRIATASRNWCQPRLRRFNTRESGLILVNNDVEGSQC